MLLTNNDEGGIYTWCGIVFIIESVNMKKQILQLGNCIAEMVRSVQ